MSSVTCQINRNGHLITCLLLLLLMPAWAGAAEKIYKRVLPDGSVVFSDEPGPGAEVVELPPVQTVPALPLVVAPADEKKKKEPPPITYERLRIAYPADDMPIRENSGRVEVEVELHPPLQRSAGHRLVLKLDSRVVATAVSGTRFVLDNVDRGTHEVVAEIQDAQGKTLKRSPPVIFHLLRASRLHPRN